MRARSHKNHSVSPRALVLPLPRISRPRLCPVAAFSHHFDFKPDPGSAPLFFISAIWIGILTFLSKAIFSSIWSLRSSQHIVLDVALWLLHLTVILLLKLSSRWEMTERRIFHLPRVIRKTENVRLSSDRTQVASDGSVNLTCSFVLNISSPCIFLYFSINHIFIVFSTQM